MIHPSGAGLRLLKPGAVLGLIVAAVCTFGGCTAPNDSESSANSTAVSEPVPTANDSTSPAGSWSGPLPQANWNTVMDPPPPLAKYAADLGGPPPDASTVAAMQDWYDNVADSTAACMTAQGFRYVPNPTDASKVFIAGNASSWVLSLPVPYLPSDRDTVTQVGYGVMGTPEEQDAAQGMGDDPNDAYRQTLSPSEAQAYDAALFGDYNNPTQTSGCSSEAMAQYPEPDQSSDRQQAFYAEFNGLVSDVKGLVLSDTRASTDGFWYDSRTLDLDSEWGSCMEAKGFVFDPLPSEHGPMLGMGLAMRTHPDGTVGPVYYGVPAAQIPDDEKSLLGSDPERAVAVADFDCRTQMNYLPRLADIRDSLDTAFIQQHQADFDKLEAAAETW